MKPSLKKPHISPIEQYMLVSISGRNSKLLCALDIFIVLGFVGFPAETALDDLVLDHRTSSGKTEVKPNNSGNPVR